MSHVQDSFSLQGGRITFIHRPTQGWTVKESLYPIMMTNWKGIRSLLLPMH